MHEAESPAAGDAAPARSDAPSSSVGRTRPTVRRFFLVMALLVAGIVAYGFSFTLDQRLLHAAPRKPWIVWVHAAVFFGWVGLFAAQATLVSLRRLAWHRRLGVAGLVWGSLIPVVGIATALVSARMKSVAGADARAAAEAFLVIPLNDMLCFTTLFVSAAMLRPRPEYHRRLMFLATCCLTAAAYPRMPMINITAIRWYGGVDLLIAIGIARDLLVERRIHRVYQLAALPLLVLQTLTMAIFMNRPGWWMTLAGRLIG